MNAGGRPQAPSQSAAKPTTSECSRKARQRFEQHHASLELDRLLDVYAYPDVIETYGATPALLRALETEVVS